MARLRSKSSSFVYYFLFFIFMLFLILLFGQGLGRFYVEKITREVVEDTRSSKMVSRSSTIQRESTSPKKVLRLKQVEYFTLQVMTADEREQVLACGQELGRKGFPVIISGDGPYEVLLGFVNKETALLNIKETIKVDEAEIRKDYLNKFTFKFAAEDALAVEQIAPFLGKVSLCLEKGLFLYQGVVVNEEVLISLRPKFSLLADSLAEVALVGQRISEDSNPQVSKSLQSLSGLCSQWGDSLRLVGEEWTDLALLKSQQQGLALLEEYHYFVKKTN